MTNSRRALVLLNGMGRRLRSARIMAGYEDARAFAKVLGIEDNRYRRYDRGEVMPPIDILEKIHTLTGMSMDHMLLGLRSDGEISED